MVLSKLVVKVDPVLHMLGFLVAYERGYFRELGVDIELFILSSGDRDLRGDPYIQLSEEVVDVTATGVTTMHLEAARAGMDFKTVASRGELVESGSGWVLLVRRDLYDSEGVTRTTDLKGKKVGIPGRKEGRSYPHYLLVKDLRQQKMAVEDLGVVVGSPWFLSQALADKRVDATWLQPGFAEESIESGMAVEIKRDYDVTLRTVPLGVISYSGRLIRERRELGEKFLEGYLRGVGLLHDPDPQEMGRVANKYLGLSREVVSKIPGTDHWPYVPRDGRINVSNLERFQQENHDLGLLKGEPKPVESWLDLSFGTEG